MASLYSEANPANTPVEHRHEQVFVGDTVLEQQQDPRKRNFSTPMERITDATIRGPSPFFLSVYFLPPTFDLPLCFHEGQPHCT